MFRRSGIVFLVSLLIGQMAFADGLIPDRRLSLTRNVDFYGGDLTNIFDTTLGACQRACLADDNCKAFTFNEKSNACFPKSNVERTEPYEGAISARVLEASSEAVARADARGADLAFLPERDLIAAVEQALKLSDLYVANEYTTQQYIDAALRDRNAGKPEVALKFMGAALTLSDGADLWDQYARDAYSVARENSQKRRQFGQTGYLASVNSYLRSENSAQQVNALALIARGLEATGRGKEAIKPLRLAQDISPRDDIGKALDRVIRLFGFSLAETQVESDALEPRICANFSEELDKTVEYADYVKSQVPGVSIEASGRALCIAGLQHGERYSFTFRQGLPAASGEALQKSIEITQYVRDRKPDVRFPGRAYVLPAAGEVALPVVAINAPELELTLYRVSDRNILRTMQEGYFGRPLSEYQRNEFRREVGSEIWTGTGAVETELNQDVTTRLPVGEIVGDLLPGVYALQAKVPGVDEYDTPPATQWFVISDLGVTTMSGVDGLHVFVRGLSDAGAKAGTEVNLLSRSNAVLGSVTTDEGGYARFDAGLSRGTGGQRPGLLTVQNGDDFSFLSLTDPEFDLSDRGVEGRAAAPPIDVFMTTERGAYRAGETIHALALARDGTADAIEGMALTAILTRPDGVEYSRTTLDDQGAGGRVFAMPLSGSVPRGTWTIGMFADVDAAPLAETRVLVEDFLPERIDVELSMPDGPISLANGPPQLGVQADYLFGAPGSNLAIDGDVILRAASAVDGFDGYKFGRHDQRLQARRGFLEGGVRTNDAGAASLEIELPELEEVMQPLEARIVTRVREGSNRPVERVLTKQVLADTPLIGIKPLADGVIPEDTEASFNLVAVGPDLTRQSMQVRWTVNRVSTRYQWYSSYGSWYWDPITTRKRIATGEATLSPDQITTVSTPVEWGEYEIKVERIDGPYVASSVSFSAGWYGAADASATPDVLEASMDKDSYRSGETATFRIVPRSPGTALVTVMSNRLVDMKTVEVTEGENLIELPVTDDWGAGVYVAAQVVQPLTSQADQTPTRALGLSYAPVEPADAKLTASFDMADEAAPRGPMQVALKVDGITEGETAYAMISAVDLGILNLTGFEPPSATDHYFGQRKLGMGLRDIYGRLIDGQTGALGTVRSGGDAQAGLSSQAPPPTEELVAYVSGPVTVGTDGVARAEFDLPEFNGTVRLSAVVWSDSAVGEATKDILVRDPVVVTATLPRFLAPGDASQLLLEIVHATGATGEMPVTVTASGIDLGAAPTAVTLGDKQKQVFAVPIEAQQTGIATVSITLVTPDDKVLRKNLFLPIMRNDPVIQRRAQFDLAAGGTFTLDQNAFAGFLPGTARATLAAGPLARFDAPGLLDALDRYPYGCTEQTTSRALPLLYLDQVAHAMNLDARDNIAERIKQAVDRVLTNQSSNGAFGLWRAQRGDMWLDAYVTDFLSRANAQGHDVPQIAFRQALDNLRNQVNSAPDFEDGGEGLAYGLLVLAREGAAAIGDLRYYADVKADSFGSPMALAQIGAALAAYGDPTRADAMFRLADARLQQARPEGQRWRDDYGTNLRDAAAVLTLAVEAGSNAVNVDRISAQVAPRIGDVSGRSTQESVWSLLAANALLARSDNTLTLNGSPVQGPLVQVLEQDALTPVAIGNTGASNTVVTMTTFGVASEPEPQGGNGYRIDREYYTLEGEATSPEEVASGERLVAVLTVQPFNNGEGRLMVNDPLPAGFEIDNPNLLQSGDVRSLNWLNISNRIRNTEFRQDRFLTAVDHGGKDAFQLAYIVRAIAPGSYHHPAASVEDMYRPEFRARTATGRVVVTK
ncbi:alpha-2-macroglobulin family protein [uncultured Litoreibacter sp.]|uniref:alpha-2-macroglobulin family protein n=1 Tax=uncultured Litoreibacter sp. TaxID=1392394 RepID=UPI0026329E5C|nr:alpha-2-macroglobulin family protein [uncultured Litoreibacter sp.]